MVIGVNSHKIREQVLKSAKLKKTNDCSRRGYIYGVSSCPTEGYHYHKFGRHGHFAKKCRLSARSVNTVDDSDTEDLYQRHIDTHSNTLNTERSESIETNNKPVFCC